MSGLDETHDPARRSWVPGADGHADFPIQNLPIGVFSTGDRDPCGGIAIGDHILDLKALAASGLLIGEAQAACEAAGGASLNPWLALTPGERSGFRRHLSDLLWSEGVLRPQAEEMAAELLVDAAAATLHLPAVIGDYTDFYAGIRHAENVGKLFRPDNPLLPNYRHVPIGYHGRASSIRPSGTDIRRPNGQTKAPDADRPGFGPCRRLDYETELAIWIGPGNALGEPIAIDQAASHIAGYGLLNDWSARDIQAWEYQPLGPFLAKNFASTVSPWIVTAEALAPFRRPRPERGEGEPQPLPYLDGESDREAGGLDLSIEVYLSTPAMREAGIEPVLLARCRTRDLYWTPAQMVAHHASGGCDLRPGDLLGSGTISGDVPGSLGSLLEITEGGKRPIDLPGGETRTFLEDGDEIIMRARASRPGAVPIGFGECRAIILPAPETGR